MRPHDQMIIVAIKGINKDFDAAVEQVILLPGRTDENLFSDLRLDGSVFVGSDKLFQQRITEFNQCFFLGAVNGFGSLYFFAGVRSDTEYRVKIIQSMLTETHMDAGSVVGHIDIFNILAHKGALDVIIVEIRRSHNHHIGIHFHHHGDHFLHTDVIGLDAWLLLGQREDSILGIVCDIVDGDVGLFQQIADERLIILIKTAALGIKNKVFVGDAEKALIVGFFSFFLFAFAKKMPFIAKTFQRCEFLAAFLQCFVVDIFLGRYHCIECVQLHNSKQIAGYPIQRDTGGNEKAQIKGKPDGKRHGAVFIESALFSLKYVGCILRKAEQPGRRPGNDRHNNRNAQNNAGIPGKIDAQKV